MMGQVLLLLFLHRQPFLERPYYRAHKLLCMVQSYFSSFLVVCILYVSYILLHHIYVLECLFCSCSPCSQYKIQCWTMRSSLCGHVNGISIIWNEPCNLLHELLQTHILHNVESKVNNFESQISSFKVVFFLQFLEPMIFRFQNNSP